MNDRSLPAAAPLHGMIGRSYRAVGSAARQAEVCRPLAGHFEPDLLPVQVTALV
jgi:hypothetical protein